MYNLISGLNDARRRSFSSATRSTPAQQMLQLHICRRYIFKDTVYFLLHHSVTIALSVVLEKFERRGAGIRLFI